MSYRSADAPELQDAQKNRAGDIICEDELYKSQGLTVEPLIPNWTSKLTPPQPLPAQVISSNTGPASLPRSDPQARPDIFKNQHTDPSTSSI
ncbi:hypothetical protein FRC08_005032 [Ceratobasidium sp. 394]|nr:hypothetical protein FRC08_005032 [Ceratobasidium sp. 394]